LPYSECEFTSQVPQDNIMRDITTQDKIT
jgi:hypothetical protein